MHRVARFIAIFLLSFVPVASANAQSGQVSTQYLIISFDGAEHVSQWQRSRALARRIGANFTYFLSCVYLLTREDRALYDPPGHGKGRSNVGFAASRDDVAQRLRQIWTARLEGHEIASHGCGHFDGSGWSASQWGAEFDAFARVLADSWSINRIQHEPAGWRDFATNEITGFRAPYLATGQGLFDALQAAGFSYDASGVSSGPRMPERGALSRFALPMIEEGPKSRAIIAMDYNLFVRHSGGLERGDREGVFEERALAAFRSALDAERAGARQPLQIGFHFTLMNDGAYWRALEQFAEEACALPDIRCVSYRDYLAETVPADG
jgi:peptidoglycan/xylan/chitin deacetylase (PgdA/CDA1 family)